MKRCQLSVSRIGDVMTLGAGAGAGAGVAQCAEVFSK